MSNMFNTFLTEEYAQHNLGKQKSNIQRLKQVLPEKTEDELIKIYNECVSIHQSKIQRGGEFLEKQICEFLGKNNIPFKTQVSINKEGIIVGFNIKKSVSHVVDIVIGGDIEIGKSITEFDVISCKTTCRERWTQDNWSFIHKPQLFILATLSDDYPPSKRFNECETRKIITSKPKLKEDRIFKLNFDDLLSLLV